MSAPSVRVTGISLDELVRTIGPNGKCDLLEVMVQVNGVVLVVGMGCRAVFVDSGVEFRFAPPPVPTTTFVPPGRGGRRL